MQVIPSHLPIELVLSVFSVFMTTYFWLVKARRERPQLKFFQMHGFRCSLRRGQSEDKRLLVSQVQPGGVLVANNSTLQNSIHSF